MDAELQTKESQPLIDNRPAPSGDTRRGTLRILVASLITAAIVIGTGAFIAGKASTNSTREQLSDQLDNANQSIVDLSRERDDSTAQTVELKKLVTSLKDSAAASSVKAQGRDADHADLETKVEGLEADHADLETNAEQAGVCASAVTAAETLVTGWQDAYRTQAEWWMTEPGSDEELSLGEELDNQMTAIDDQSANFYRFGGRCVAALDTLATQSGDTINPADCRVARATLEVAVEAFIAKNGQPPDDETDLVSAGFIRSESDHYDVTGKAVQATTDSPCE